MREEERWRENQTEKGKGRGRALYVGFMFMIQEKNIKNLILLFLGKVRDRFRMFPIFLAKLST